MTIHKCARVCAALMLSIALGLTQGCSHEEKNADRPSETAEQQEQQAKDDEQGKFEGSPNEPDYIKEARKKNSDVVGWIKIPNTVIDYPVLITNNNDFYIENNIDKKPAKQGALFFDYRNADKNQRRNLIIYGHNMKDGSMFHELNNFKGREFFNNTRQLTLWAWGEERVYEVYAQFVVTTDVPFISTSFTSDKNYTDYVQELRNLSKFKADVKVDAEDEILTLSTCTYEYDEARCVVMAVRIK